MHIKLTNIMDMIASSSSGLGNSACHTDAILISKRVQKMLEFTNNSIIVNKSLIQKVTSKKNALFSDFTTMYVFADPNHLLPTGKSSGKSKYVVPKIQPVRPSSVYAAAVT